MIESDFEMIAKRKSFHLFRNIGDQKITKSEIDGILDEYQRLTPLDSSIKTAIRIVKESETTCQRGSEYVVLFYSERKENYLPNIGYLGEQLDLYLVSKNIGTLWFGIGLPKDDKYQGLDFVIMMAISKVDDISKFRKDMTKSKRKAIDEIWSGTTIEGVTDIVRFAPSACNMQPWFIKNDNKKLEVYQYHELGKRGIMPKNKVNYYHDIDIGIFLCFLDICLNNKKLNYKRELIKPVKKSETMTLFAIYNLVSVKV